MTVWVVGAPAVPYACGALALVGLVSGLTMAYAQRLGVTLTGGVRVLRWRLLPYVALVVALLVGALRADAGDSSTSFARGLATGAVVGLVLAVLATWRAASASRCATSSAPPGSCCGAGATRTARPSPP